MDWECIRRLHEKPRYSFQTEREQTKGSKTGDSTPVALSEQQTAEKIRGIPTSPSARQKKIKRWKVNGKVTYRRTF